MDRPGGVLLDLDGTLYSGDEAIEGAADAVARLRESGLPLLFVTNTTRRPVRDLVERLGAFGIPAGADEIFTAPRAAVHWLHERGLRRVHPLLLEATHEDLTGLELVDSAAQAVLVGDLGDAWDRARLDHAFRLIHDGARLVAVQKNRYGHGADGLELDAGAFVVALEFAAGVRADVVGKPNPAFFAAAARQLGQPIGSLVTVGDDLQSDVGGGRRAGARGVLVRTGKFRPADEDDPEVRPDAVIDSVADLPACLAEL